jgi:hypothetical protein
MKTCTKCKREWPLSNFFRDNRRNGYRSHCKPCCQEAFRNYTHRVGYNKIRYQAIKESERWRHVAKKYGLSRQSYQDIFIAQGGRCAICRTDNPGMRPFVVDHDHANGQVRGLLCASCNHVLGYAKDRPETLIAAANYLQFKSRPKSSQP